MKSEVQTSADLARVCDLIKDIRVAMLTTIDVQQDLISRPMTALEMDATGALWFFTDVRSTKVAQLKKANLAFADPDHGTYVSLAGHGEISSDRTRIKALWTAFAKPWFPDGPDSENLGLLKFVPSAAEYWDAPSSKMVRMFALAASIVSGKAAGMGEHDSFHNLTATPKASAAA
jgi:general stress protein 26